jgi:hypothetical protein
MSLKLIILFKITAQSYFKSLMGPYQILLKYVEQDNFEGEQAEKSLPLLLSAVKCQDALVFFLQLLGCSQV